jgi:hypothetical protein
MQFIFVPADSIRITSTEQEDVARMPCNAAKNTPQIREAGWRTDLSARIRSQSQ